MEVQLHQFLTLALDGDERSSSRLSRFASGKECLYQLSGRLETFEKMKHRVGASARSLIRKFGSPEKSLIASFNDKH